MVALLVAIAGGAVTAGVAGARRAGSSVDRYIAKSSPSSVVIFSQEPLDAALTSELDADPRVTGRYVTRIVVATQVGVPPGSGGVTLAVPDEFWGGVAEPRIVEGRYPSGPDEIAMTESMSDRGVEVGDTVQMHLMSAAETFTCFERGECETEPAGEVTVTGVLRVDGDLAPGAFSSEGNWIAPAEFAPREGRATGHVRDRDQRVPRARHADRRRRRRLPAGGRMPRRPGTRPQTPLRPSGPRRSNTMR